MATVIYNHREMEYIWKKFWKENYADGITFDQIFQNTAEEAVKHAGCQLVEQLAAVAFPEDYAMDYGYDTMRLYLMFAGEPKKGDEYEEGALEGIYKFLNRLMILVHSSATATEAIAHNETRPLGIVSNEEVLTQITVLDAAFMNKMHTFLTEGNGHMLVASFMEQTTRLSAILHQHGVCIPGEILEHLLQMLAPFAPFMSEALWHELGKEASIFLGDWPQVEEMKLHNIPETITIAVQINGKKKAVLTFEQEVSETEVLAKAREVLQERFPAVYRKVIYIPGKIMNVITE